MWPREEEREERRALTDLFNIDWRETSFVPAGDNPPARLVMWKDEPLSDEEIEEIIDEVATEKRRPGVTTKAFGKAGDVLAERDRLAREKMAKQDGLTIAQARVEVWLENPGLQERYQQLRIQEHEAFASAQEPQVVPVPVVEKGAQPYAALHRVAKAELPELYRSNPSAAVAEISKSRPDLRDDYYRASRS
jgi:hypothetical protein